MEDYALSESDHEFFLIPSVRTMALHNAGTDFTRCADVCFSGCPIHILEDSPLSNTVCQWESNICSKHVVDKFYAGVKFGLAF
jgi:hypothetical protein